MESLLLNYGPTGLLALFMLYLLREFKGFINQEIESCEARYAELFRAYVKISEELRSRLH